VNVSPDLELVLFWENKHLKIQLQPAEARELAARLLSVVESKNAANN
jgi:hypothetical protein